MGDRRQDGLVTKIDGGQVDVFVIDGPYIVYRYDLSRYFDAPLLAKQYESMVLRMTKDEVFRSTLAFLREATFEAHSVLHGIEGERILFDTVTPHWLHVTLSRGEQRYRISVSEIDEDGLRYDTDLTTVFDDARAAWLWLRGLLAQQGCDYDALTGLRYPTTDIVLRLPTAVARDYVREVLGGDDGVYLLRYEDPHYEDGPGTHFGIVDFRSDVVKTVTAGDYFEALYEAITIFAKTAATSSDEA
ncbi:MAG: hypothetical protein D6683_01575 [Actinomyces sp.]|nr:MAG: hypothetical protein D6683_01575 [Actinomyces sp.]